MTSHHACVDARRQAQRVSGPSQESIPLCHHPVQSSIEMHNNHGSDGGLCRNQSGIGCRRSHSLIDERHPKECSPERSKQRQCRHSLFNSISPSHRKECDVHPTFSGFPLKPTNVPLRVYKFWEAEMDAERRENGLLSTSKRASTTVSAMCIFLVYGSILPALGLELLPPLAGLSVCVGSVEDGVALI